MAQGWDSKLELLCEHALAAYDLPGLAVGVVQAGRVPGLLADHEGPFLDVGDATGCSRGWY